MKCPHCSSENISDEEETLVCLNCGFVLNDSPFQVCPDSTSHPEQSDFGYTLSNTLNTDIYSSSAYYVPHRSNLTHFVRIRRCVRVIRSIRRHLNLPQIIEVHACHMVRVLLGNLQPHAEPPISASLTDMLALVFLTIRINKHIVFHLKDILVCHFLYFLPFLVFLELLSCYS